MSLDRFVLKNEVLKITGKSYPTIWRWVKAGIFPAPKKIGPNSIGWLESDIRAWLESKAAA